jgi:hypothetical protein
MSVQQPPEIILPEPEGHRRGTLAFKNGARDAMNIADPLILAGLLERFLRDESAELLILEDANFGAPYVLTRAGAREVVSIGTAWLARVAPQRASKLQIARDLPPGLN